MVLRIEDTDATRGRQEWLDGIISALDWLGLQADEGPYLQSAAEPRHRELADKLYDAGYLYACDCPRELIDERTKSNPTPGYDGFCRDRSVPRTDQTGLRFKVPIEGETVVTMSFVEMWSSRIARWRTLLRSSLRASRSLR